MQKNNMKIRKEILYRTLSYKRIWFLSLIPLAMCLKNFTKNHTNMTEQWFSRRIYKYYAVSLGSVTGKLPFSLMELAIVSAPFLALALLVFFIVRLSKSKGRLMLFLGKSCLNILAVSSVVYFWLVLMCGVNYNRVTFADRSGLTIRESSAQELYELCLMLAKQANSLRAELGLEDEEGAFQLADASVKNLSKTAREAYQSLSRTYDAFDYQVPDSKPVFFSSYMSYLDLVGVYCPFTMETNINTDVAQYSIPSTICHEMAHYYGYMREDEANFIAYLVCMNSDSLEFQYSGTLLALIHAGNQMLSADSELFHDLWDVYSEELITDLAENSEYWKKFKDKKVTEVSTAFNDSYLKANNQTDGVKSYGRMVDLLLTFYRKE